MPSAAWNSPSFGSLSTSTVCSPRQRLDDALVGIRPVVDDQNAAVAPGLVDRIALRTVMPISFDVTARMRSSSVTIFSRASERTREISASR